MEEFDFSAPISTELIFDESDDETKSIDNLPIIQAIPEGTFTNIRQTTQSHHLQNRRLKYIEHIENVVQEKKKRSFKRCKQSKESEEKKRKRLSKNKESKHTKTINKNDKFKNTFSNNKDSNFSLKKSSDNSKQNDHRANKYSNRIDNFNINVAKMKICTEHKQKSLDMPPLDTIDLFTEDFEDICYQVDYGKITVNNNNLHQIDNQNSETRNKDTQDKNNVELTNESNCLNDSKPLNIEPNTAVENCYQNTELNRNSNENAKSVCASQITFTKETEKIKQTKLNEKSSLLNRESKETHHVNVTQNEGLVTIEINPNVVVEDYYNAQINSFNADPHVNSNNNKNKSDLTNNSDYIEQLLRTVSEHMIYILNAYNVYIKIYNTSRNQDILYRARNSFIHTKQHFFDLSYSSVMNIIIPKQNDAAFVRDFINNTLILAHSRSYKYSTAHVEPLYSEMMEWVKKRKQNVEKINKMNVFTNQISYPMLTDMLNKPCKPVQMKKPPPYKDPTKMSNSKTTTCASRTDASGYRPGNNIHTLYANPDIQRMSSYCIPPTEAPQPTAQNPCEYQNYYNKNQENTIQRLNSSILALQGQINGISPSQKSIPYTKQTNYFSEMELNTRQNYHGNQPLTCSRNTQQCQRGLPRPEVTGAESNRQVQFRPEMLTQGHHWPAQLPPAIHRPENPVHNSNDQQPVELNRSSVSRDSGFMSPLNFNGTGDQLCNMQVEPCAESSPLITHVTSLSSNAAYITEGSCCVCRKMTRKMCQGCYNSYYCSSECQYGDWNNHRKLCRA